MFLARWITQRCRRLWGKQSSAAPIRPAPPSEMTSSGACRPRAVRPPKNPAHASWDSELPQAQEHRLAGGGDAPRDQDRLGRGARVHLEERPVGKQVVELDLGQVVGLPGVELGLDRLAD